MPLSMGFPVQFNWVSTPLMKDNCTLWVGSFLDISQELIIQKIAIIALRMGFNIRFECAFPLIEFVKSLKNIGNSPNFNNESFIGLFGIVFLWILCQHSY